MRSDCQRCASVDGRVRADETALVEEKDSANLIEVGAGQLGDRLGPIGYTAHRADIHHHCVSHTLPHLRALALERQACARVDALPSNDDTLARPLRARCHRRLSLAVLRRQTSAEGFVPHRFAKFDPITNARPHQRRCVSNRPQSGGDIGLIEGFQDADLDPAAQYRVSHRLLKRFDQCLLSLRSLGVFRGIHFECDGYSIDFAQEIRCSLSRFKLWIVA